MHLYRTSRYAWNQKSSNHCVFLETTYGAETLSLKKMNMLDVTITDKTPNHDIENKTRVRYAKQSTVNKSYYYKNRTYGPNERLRVNRETSEVKTKT
ncbi:hypothetical protein WA026_013241 [Henosepilachna vigintioctopunctata]|uniref:Uncharacterized protein n=1 Tax=Henosepilachna vigintioctopunctata TaxID=420089 RepID=A0AAW1UD26_9CUCU